MRLWGIFSTALLVAVTLTSCASEEVQAAERSVGDCWEIPTGLTQEEFLDNSQESINCGDSALSSTYFVGEISDAPLGGYLSEQFLQASSLAALPDSMHQDLINSCQTELKKLLSLDSYVALRQTRLVWDFTLPSHKSWESGSRWYSCELSVLEKGSLLVEPIWAPLPDGFATVQAMAKNGTELTLCFDTSSNNDLPNSRDGIVSNCDTARWKLSPLVIDNGYGEFYPGRTQVAPIAKELCQTKFSYALAVYVAPLLEDDWNAPEPTVLCWVSNKNDPQSQEELEAEKARIAAEQQSVEDIAQKQAASNRAWQQYLDDQANQAAEQSEAERVAAEQEAARIEAERVAAEQEAARIEAERVARCLEDPTLPECVQP